MESKRQRLEEGGAPPDDSSQLAHVLSKLTALVTQGTSEAAGLDELLEQLGRLQAKLNGTSDPVFIAIEDAQARLQAAIVALQTAVDRLTPPPGYRPPAPGDEAAVRSLLSYAHRLSYSSAAPLGYQPGQPLYFFKPPAPQEAEMRASQLHAFAREWEEREQAKEAQRLAEARGAAAPAAAPAAPAGAALPPAAGDLAALAAQHGLDVKQLLASMPPGWKPGDPITLGAPAAAAAAVTPAAAAPLAAAVAQQQQQQQQPAAVPAAAQREVSPEAAAAPAAPRLAGLFLNELNFQEYDYVSEDEEEESSEEDSDED